VILKGSQRGNGADLAIHLMNLFDNEQVEIAEVYGTVAGDLYGAFAEFEAVAAGTRASEPLYSLSINPPAPLTREQYFEAIQTIETGLGLTGQPRAVIFHVKDGREHCHVVWSRIDIEKMRAIQMSHDRRRLMDMACELARKYGLSLPPGLKAWEAKQKFEKDFLEASLAERAQQKITGITPEQRRADITAAYDQSDSAEAFRAALEEKGYVLAKGDRRGLVVVDERGGVHSLTRYVKGHTAKQIKARLAALNAQGLPSVDQAKDMARQRAQAQQERAREQQGDQQHDEEEQRFAESRRRAEATFAGKQAARRLELQQAEQELLTRQQAEKLSLHAAQKSESRGLLFRVRIAVADLIGRTPALRSVLGHIQKLTHLDPAERHRLESEALVRRHDREKLDIERRKRMLTRVEKREWASFERTHVREQRLREAARQEREREKQRTAQARTVDNKAMQDFHDAARDQGLWKHRVFKEGELRESFNNAAEFEEGADKAGGDDDGLAPSRNAGSDDDGGDDDNSGPSRRRRRGKGYGYRR
jgi:MobA/VirD2-like, nuclease domain